jgi:polar amino acid transport system substrate-binding protein
MHRRRWSTGLVVLAAGLMLAACSSSKTSGSTTSAPPTNSFGFVPMTPATLTVDAYVPFPGFWNGTSPSQLTGGLEYKIAQALQKDFNLKNLVVRTVNFTALTGGLITNYDVAMADIYPTPARAKVNQYSSCYTTSQTVAVVKKGTPLSTVAQAKKLNWGIEVGSATGDIILNGVKPDSAPREFEDTAAMMPLLLTGDVNAVANDLTDIAPYLAKPEYKDFYIPAQFTYASPETSDQCGAIQLPKTSKNVVAVDKALKQLIANGSINRWTSEYLTPTLNGIDPSKIPIISIPG